MSWFTTKRDKADILFSKYIRIRDGQCVRCGMKGTGQDGIVGLDASHFWSRRKESVRYDVENVDALCRKDHKYFGEHREAYQRFKKEQLGERAYDLLEIRANTYAKKDRFMAQVVAKELLNSLKK